MRRDAFLKSLLVLTATAGASRMALAGVNMRMLIPSNPGGGWDATGRAFGKAMVEAKVADAVQYDNRGGAAGVIGLGQFVNASKGNPNALMVMGAVMLGGIITGRPQVSLDRATPIARLTSEFNVFVVPAASPFTTMRDVVRQMQKDPGSVKWGGGSRGTTEHICVSLLASRVGVDPKRVNYVPFRGGGEAAVTILGGHVTVGGGGYSELAEHIAAGRIRPIGVTSEKRLPGVNVPTLKELGYDVVLGNWRGLYAAPGITPEQRAALTDMVITATKTKSWTESMERNGWTSALLTGKAFDDFVDAEFASLRGIMHLVGMV